MPARSMPAKSIPANDLATVTDPNATPKDGANGPGLWEKGARTGSPQSEPDPRE